MEQISNSILMIKPVRFRYNEQTIANNYYQHILEHLSPDQVQNNALREFSDLVAILTNAGVNVLVFEDTKMPDTPDSIFPNNWVSFHEDGRVGLFPMFAENRRHERRTDILSSLVDDYNFVLKEIIDYTSLEDENIFLEGTGSMVLDRVNKLCYATISERTNRIALEQFCHDFAYTPITFTANQTVVGQRLAMYHTNVMMCLGDSFAVICLDAIDDPVEKARVADALLATEKSIIEISENQTGRFAGNMLHVIGKSPLVVMSTSAYESLDTGQITEIEKHGEILHSPLHTIEACGGGSARCMMAELFLPKI